MIIKHCTKFQVSTISRLVGEVSTRFCDRQTDRQTESTKTRDVCETLMPPLDIHCRVHNPLFWAWMETANYWNFSKSKDHNSVKNSSFVPKRECDLHILTINIHTKFHFNMCIQCKENERKLQITGIFQSPRAITLSQMAWSYPKENLI